MGKDAGQEALKAVKQLESKIKELEKLVRKIEKVQNDWEKEQTKWIKKNFEHTDKALTAMEKRSVDRHNQQAKEMQSIIAWAKKSFDTKGWF